MHDRERRRSRAGGRLVLVLAAGLAGLPRKTTPEEFDGPCIGRAVRGRLGTMEAYARWVPSESLRGAAFFARDDFAREFACRNSEHSPTS